MKFSDMPYQRVDLEAVRTSFRDLTERMEKAGSGAEQFAIHQEYYAFFGHVMTEATLAGIRHDIDMSDPFYTEEQQFYDEIMPEVTHLNVIYNRKLLNSPYRPYLEEKIGKPAFKNIEIQEKSVDEVILPLMQEENRLKERYNQLLSSARIDWHGESLNLSLMNPYLQDKDRQVRVEAYEKFFAFFSENQEELDEIYDRLVKNRTAQAAKLGYENFLPLGDFRMNRNCYGREEMRAFREQVKRDFVPFAEKLHERRRQRLGLKRLHFEDEKIYFPDGNPAPVLSPEGILDAGKKMYGELSPETWEFMDFMTENELFDVQGRKNKKTGGYMTYLQDFKSPFIFANFNGTQGDVDVITHECGHAFQGYLSGKDPILEHGDITMETAETHSMSMEFFTEPWMKLFFGARSQDYVDMHFEDSCVFIPYGTMVDEFQEIVYQNPGLSPKERRQVWRELERVYKPHLDYSGNEYLESGGFWQRQHHIYEFPFYYLDYAIAQTDALQYKVWMDRDYQAAWESYLHLCRLSAKDFYTGLLPQVSLRSPFEDGCLRDVVRELSRKLCLPE